MLRESEGRYRYLSAISQLMIKGLNVGLMNKIKNITAKNSNFSFLNINLRLARSTNKRITSQLSIVRETTTGSWYKVSLSGQSIRLKFENKEWATVSTGLFHTGAAIADFPERRSILDINPAFIEASFNAASKKKGTHSLQLLRHLFRVRSMRIRRKGKR